MKKMITFLLSVLLVFVLAACGEDNQINAAGVATDELEYIPSEYKTPSEHPGTLEKLTYQTWESFSYEEHT